MTSLPTDGAGPLFPFTWPDEAAARLQWRKRSPGSVPLRPFDADLALHRRRSPANGAAIKGAETSERALIVNGRLYVATIPSPFTETDRHARKMAFELAATALVEQGHTYYEKVVFPEVDATNARLAAVAVFAIPAEALTLHLLEVVRWYERASTLHRLRIPDDPRVRFTKLFAEVTADPTHDGALALFACAPALLEDAIDGILELVQIVQRHPHLRQLLRTESPREVLASLGATPGGDAFASSLDRLLRTHGLRCGDNPGNEWEPTGPSWLEEPSLVVALVQRYCVQDGVPSSSDGPVRHDGRAASLARRDERTRVVRERIGDPETRARFDFWLEGARRSVQNYEDHSYKINSGAAALVRLALVAAGRRLAEAGRIGHEDDVRWLHVDEIAFALRGLEAADAASSSHLHWPSLVAARRQHFEWQAGLRAPEVLGAISSPAKETKEDSSTATPTAPSDVLVVGKGQAASAAVVSGRVRVMSGRNSVIPAVEPGEVLVSGDVSPTWAPLLPLAVAVVLEGSAPLAHGALACRRVGVPLVYQAQGARSRLAEGQVVAVDPVNGWVLPGDRPDGSAP